MNTKLAAFAWFPALALAFSPGSAHAQAPEPKGPVAKPLLNLDLGPEMDSVAGRALRMQLATYEPGASNKPHSHKDRPEVVYILSGKVIEHRGDVAKEYGPGRYLHRRPHHDPLDGEQGYGARGDAGDGHRQEGVTSRAPRGGFSKCGGSQTKRRPGRLRSRASKSKPSARWGARGCVRAEYGFRQ